MVKAEGCKDIHAFLRRYVLAPVSTSDEASRDLRTCASIIMRHIYPLSHYCSPRAPKGRSGETLIVYYDFACMLEKYCLARDPWLFRNVVFMIDKFHLKNHTCSSSFSYYEYDACMLARTQVCEQGPSDMCNKYRP